MRKEKNVVKIPLFVPIIIIIGIIVLAGVLGTQLIMTAAKYISSNAATSADGNYEYEELEDGTIEITKYKGVSKDVTVPSTINGKTVTSIGNGTFSYNDIIENVILPDTITNIAEYAVNGCENLRTVQLSTNLESIGDFAFVSNYNLTTIEIPESVTCIGEGAFSSCLKLEEIKVDIANKQYVVAEGILYNKAKTELVCYPAGKKDTTYTVGKGINKIGAYAFSGASNLETINIPENVKEIDIGAFSSCYELKEIVLPNGITTISDSMFNFSDKLTTVVIPETVTSIGNAAFYYCKSFNSIKIPEAVTSIGDSAFANCSSLVNIAIPKNVTTLGKSVFESCSKLEKITVSTENQQFLDKEGIVFNKEQTELVCYPAGKKGASYTIPTKVVTIRESAFSDCYNLTTIEIHDGVTAIGESAFSGCNNLANIELPKGITAIESQTFASCTSLKTLQVPSGVTRIEWWAFYNCKNLKNIELPEGLEEISGPAFEGCKNLQDLEIPEGVTNIWSPFENVEIKRVLPSTVNEIELPNIIKRAMDKNDNFYSEEGIELNECTLSEDKTKLIMNKNAQNATIRVKSDDLEGLVLRVLKTGTITYYQEYEWSDEIIATIHLAEGGKVTNNNGSNEYIFTKNGQFVFEYTDENGNAKKAVAKVDSFEEDLSNIEKIEIATQPKKTKYNSHENFDATGMKVIVKYKDGTQEETTNYTITNGEDLTCQTQRIRIQYSNSTTIYAEVPIMVSHDLQEATCTEDATCKNEDCYYREEALGHDFKNYVSNNDATCRADGTKTAKCSRCEETDTIEEVGSKKAHTYENGECTTCGQAEPKIKITSEKYDVDDTYISNIQPKITVQGLKNQLQTNATEVKVYNKDSQLQEDTSNLETGMKVEFKLGEETQTLTVIVRGDSNGDGKADFKDLTKINSHRLNKKSLESIYLLAADVNNDGTVDFKDLVKINKLRLNKISEL